ncbi:efflux RND transporter permease subunit [Alkalimonas mucilaginosa]|uniref:Efflux RND transporter permease subunit n=1 Tax=Alkalimonas mucilaginosa TaxID=3057676 RepID=A0ABU7JAV2_9GAMM|nr:efflux RND transporter permease subunit [Alkalimonas sp. MEB004]MEE2022828.1 efflux RND transporter permease subunit [Alkalimonas sp. MEB004]
MTEQPLAITRLALSRPITVCMLCISLLLFGVLASRLLPLEKFPGIDIPEIYIQAPYPNATPAEIERLITRPIEEALATVSGIQEMRSFSNENSADISLMFNWDEPIRSKNMEVRERLDAVRAQLPADLERVFVFQFNTDDMPIFQLRISSERDLALAYDLLEQHIKRPLERVPGVSKVELYGVDKRQVIIRLDPARLHALNVDPAQLLVQLRQSNFAITAGSLQNPEQHILVKPVGEFRSLSEIERLPIRPGLQLSDVATVALELPKREDGRHLNQTYAVGMNVFKDSGANLVEVANAAMAVVRAADQNPAFSGIQLYVMDDMAKGVTSSLRDLLLAGSIGAGLSFVVLFMFLRHLATTLVVVLSVPAAIIMALGAMYFLGYSLNILSMMGLMLAIGMLVDNAVVVTESIFRERALGGDVRAATERGVRRVSLAVLAGTATTAIVFLPNIIGQKMDLTIFLEHVAIAICLCLGISLVLALSLIPLLTTRLKVPEQDGAKSAFGERRYARLLGAVMRFPKLSGLLALLVLGSIVIPLGQVGSGDGDMEDNSRIFMNYRVQGNYSQEEVRAEVSQMEAYLYDNQQRFHIDSVYSYYRAGYAISIILLKDDLPMPLAQLRQQIQADWPALVRSRPSFSFGGGGGGLQLHLLGPSTEVLLEQAAMLEPMLSSLAALDNVSSDLERGQQEVQIVLNKDELARLDLPASLVAERVALALRGANLRTYRTEQQGEVQLRVQFDERISQSLAELAALPILVQAGSSIQLQQLAELNIAPRLSRIGRLNRQTGIALSMSLADGATMEQAQQQIRQLMQQVDLPAGYQWSFHGAFQRHDEAQQVMLVNMLLAVAMIYIVMAALFESLLMPNAVIGSLLFSLVGVFWTFLLTGTSMSIMGMIGMLVLMGIVVNNGIVLVDRINQERQLQPETALKEVIVAACTARLRPILMTVSTTVLGLLPLALGGTQLAGDGPSYAPMAIAIIGGLLFSTLTSLLLVPLTYYALVRLREATSRLLQGSSRWANQVWQVQS